jgi:hypothetical protein
VATWDDVRELALALPETEESTSWRQPAVRVRGTWFGGLSPHEDGALVLRCDGDERQMMLAASPDVFWVTPHYEPSPSFVLVRLEAIDRDELRERLEDAWALAAPKRLLRERQSAQPG